MPAILQHEFELAPRGVLHLKDGDEDPEPAKGFEDSEDHREVLGFPAGFVLAEVRNVDQPGVTAGRNLEIVLHSIGSADGDEDPEPAEGFEDSEDHREEGHLQLFDLATWKVTGVAKWSSGSGFERMHNGHVVMSNSGIIQLNAGGKQAVPTFDLDGTCREGI
ncbi:hypothetical protein AK812_SmicGene14440 [Symbiodinium microadriaticum]|uniref:Uncharacterized protein n=1 Tax=Symbiodinium microadriaticum TaxID=2951 RepID=A0A1Q9E5H5_SYMMI|nr:hypothetical protein AK812_SmicGene14440 [Symbiodinium microadriaticum]